VVRQEKIMSGVEFIKTQKNYALIWVMLICIICFCSPAHAQCSAGAACTSTPTIPTRICGNATLPVMANGASTAAVCPGGCVGSVVLTCKDGVYTITENCDIPVGACGLPSCYECIAGSCVPNPTGPYSDPNCLFACGLGY
jgi:hypothetical protein